ncbi:MAG: Thermophilic serine proteinase [Calditrichaeota bacterium]|nr:Thermophilic serine proteinase [Calditrichota bacterium]
MIVDSRLPRTATRAAAVLVLAALVPLAAQSAPKSFRIELPTRTIEPPDDGGAYFARRDVTEPSAVILQFRRNLSDRERRTLDHAGITLQEYVGGGAWAAYVRRGVEASALRGYDVRWAGELIARDKIDPRVAAGEMPPWADTRDGFLYAVAFMKNVSETDAELILRDAGAEPGAIISALNTWHALADDSFPRRIADDPRVLYVGPISPPLTAVNEGVRAAMNVDPLHQPPFNLRGDGETVCVYDGGLVDASHPDFEGRVQTGEPGGIAAHSTHVAGTVGGNGDDAHRGVAPAVSILSYFYEECNPYCLYDSPQDIYENYEEAYALGAHLFTNSIGANIYNNGYPCDWQGDYESVSALLDSLVRGPFGEPLIITWAAGNERSPGTPCGTTYETMSVPSSAKNIITVGATSDGDAMSNFSSWGPPDDGRVKPEVMAPGVNVSSCNAGGGYTTFSGTSMSTPGVAGVNALLLQAWHENVDPNTFPLPETIKALLCNNAEDLGNDGPDYQFGFGRVDALRAVQTVQSFGFEEGEITDGELITSQLEVPPGLDVLKVTLAWSDPPGGYLPAQAIVNDLDVGLMDPSGTIHRPYVLDPDNPSQPATTDINTVDVVEQVEIPFPEAGTWTLGVQGTDVPAGPQTFAIAANLPLVEGIVTITGTVTDETTGDPVEGAILTAPGPVNELSTSTLADGSYVLFAQMDGDVLVRANKLGYLPQQGWVLDGGPMTLDFALQPGEMGTVSGTVTNSEGVPIPQATIVVLEMPELWAQTNNDGEYSLNVPAGEMVTIQAQSWSLTTEQNVYLNPDETVELDFVLMPSQEKPTGPDTHGYIAVQDDDTHPQAPAYDWIEIDPSQGGDGTPVALPDEETPVVIDLPFPFTYYGIEYTQITVNENGMFAFGDLSDIDPGEAADYSNSSIPNPDGPPAMVAPFWEDFRAEETNLSYYDDGEGRFILEWWDSRQWPVDATRETFEVILYDTAVFPTGSADGSIKFQYYDVNDLGNATVGVENESEDDGIQILYFDHDGNGGYDETAGTIGDESAIVFYRPVAAVEGVVALNPENPEITPEITIGDQTVTADAEGDFSFPMISPGYLLLEYFAPEYERGTATVTVLAGDTASAPPITLWKMLPPVEASYDVLDEHALIQWSPPAFDGPQIDEFLNRYRVYRDGSMIGETEELELEDPEPYDESSMYWVTSLFTGGESDSSNHAYYQSGLGARNATLPVEFEVSPAWPNPFNPATAVRIALPQAAALKVAVYDVLGREVVRLASGERRTAGYHRIAWDATGHASGVYFLRVDAGKHNAVRKLMLLK